MTNKSRIKTPILQRWNHFRMSFLPILCFFGCVILTVILWDRQAYRGSVVGEVESVRTDVIVGSDGILMPLQIRNADGKLQQFWKLFDPVLEDETIAVLDNRLLNAELNEAHAEIKRLKADLVATRARLDADITRIQQQYIRDRYERIIDAEQARVQLLTVAIQFAEDLKTLTQLDFQIKYFVKQQASTVNLDLENQGGSFRALNQDEFSPITRQDLIDSIHKVTPQHSKQELERLFGGRLSTSFSEQDLVDTLKRRDVVKERIDRNKVLLAHRRKIETNANQRTIPFADEEMKLPSVDEMIVDLRDAQEAQQARIQRINVQLNQLEIKAPMSGIIVSVWAHPGQNLQAGSPVVTIAKKTSDFIVTYWRENQKTRPTEDLDVGIRLTQQGSEEFASKIAVVGPTVELVPVHHLKDPTSPEWGTPIKVLLPVGLNNLRPGEKVHVLYREKAK